MKLICLQSGHENIKDNCDTGLRSRTGAPGEVEFTVRIRNRLSEILQQKGFQVQLVDANFNCNPERTKDFDFFLSIHYEANTHGRGGGFMTAPDPSVDDSNTESVRIVQCLKDEYFKNTGIEEREEWITPAMRFYYMWRALTSKTPCGIIECGVGLDPHDKVILADTDRVCNAIARGICKAFSVPFDTPPTMPPPPPTITLEAFKQQIRDILASKNFFWVKMRKIKELI